MSEFDSIAEVLREPLIDAGYPYRLTFENKQDAVRNLMVHMVVLSRKSEIDQFAYGLGPVLGLIKAYPERLKVLFTLDSERALLPEDLMSIVNFEDSLPLHLKEYFQRYVTAGTLLLRYCFTNTACFDLLSLFR